MTDTEPLLTLPDVDRDGALAETEAQALEVAAAGHTRSSFRTRGPASPCHTRKPTGRRAR